jgi:type I restriction enzyme S subunit
VGTTGIPVLVDTDEVFSLFVSVALLKYSQDLLYGAFLVNLLESPLVGVQCEENTRGVGNKNWVIRDISNTLIVLPPLVEQHRIVARIQEIQPLLKKYDAAEQRLTTLNSAFPYSLKKSILQAAVQGKLVPQDPADEPATALLERIRAEKEKLIREGKIKRDKRESVIFRRDNSHLTNDGTFFKKIGDDERCIDDELPFDIPDSWEWVYLETICEYIQRGKSPQYSSVKKYPVVAQKCNQWSGFSIDKAQFIEPNSLSSYPELPKNYSALGGSTPNAAYSLRCLSVISPQ